MPERYAGRHLGRFRIDAAVGAGGFAWVYSGWDPELDIPVAIKVLKPQFAGDAAFEARFRREALTASHLRHPNIIRILGVGKDGDAVYFAMDYFPQNLSERLRVMQTIPERMVAKIGADVAAALAFAHREGVVHRDVKTDNILFDDHGNAIVADFGIARASTIASEDTATNMVVGTPQYFSPEQARGQPLDGRSDIYSLGVSLYRAATGKLPFTGDDWYDVARQQIEDAPRSPRELNTDLSRAFEAVVLRCLEKKAENRYANADALRGELSMLVSGDTPESTTTIIAVVPPPVDRWPRALSRYRVPLAAGGAAIVLLAAWSAFAAGRPKTVAIAPRVPPRPMDTARLPAPPFTMTPQPRETTPAGAAPAAKPPELEVSAPAQATITVSGRAVGKGNWHGTTISPGTHWVAATIATLPNCPTARDSERVPLSNGHATTVNLTPRPCGLLALAPQPESARYTVSDPSGTVLMSGRTPLPAPLTLPVGKYDFHFSAAQCADFTGEVKVEAGTTTSPKVTMLCGPK
ncbi:MAG: serine/threonine-protein kinase [Gemmatimonadaceae bacterium]